jgi:hypothetical protein
VAPHIISSVRLSKHTIVSIVLAPFFKKLRRSIATLKAVSTSINMVRMRSMIPTIYFSLLLMVGKS